LGFIERLLDGFVWDLLSVELLVSGLLGVGFVAVLIDWGMMVEGLLFCGLLWI